MMITTCLIFPIAAGTDAPPRSDLEAGAEQAPSSTTHVVEATRENVRRRPMRDIGFVGWTRRSADRLSIARTARPPTITTTPAPAPNEDQHAQEDDGGL
jgi:hypothetical protein